MTLTATQLVVRRLRSEKVSGYAVACPSARYLSTRLFSEGRLLRGFATIEAWPKIERELSIGWGTGRVPADAALHRALLPGDLGSLFALQVLLTVPIEAVDGGAAEQLDRYLTTLHVPDAAR